MVSKPDNQKEVQTLAPYQWIRMIAVYLFIPLILLVCGWDFGWWQAWVFSLLIVATGIGGRIWAERERTRFGKVPDTKPWDKR